MEKQKKYSLLVWAVVILLATNLSMGLSFLYHKQNDMKVQELTEKSTVEVPSEQQTRFFRDQLGLTAEQVNPFRELNRDYNRSSNFVARELESLRIEMVSELGKDNPDENHLRRISADIGKKHEELKNITIDYYQNMSSLCTPEQRTKLNALFLSVLKKSDQENAPQRGRRNRFGNR